MGMYQDPVLSLFDRTGCLLMLLCEAHPHPHSQVGELFEVVVFTASLDKYANPVLDLLDRTNSVHYRLFREACVMNEGSLVKDLTRLVRHLFFATKTINAAAVRELR